MFLTSLGFEKYKIELDELTNALPAMIKETGAMAALGDRSENAGYINAKQTMRKTQGRIRYLEDLLKHSTIIKNTNAKIVSIGSSISLLNLNSNKEEIYTIVDSIEADPQNGFISFNSPLGKLLLNKTKNVHVTLETPHFKTEYKILSIG